MTIKEASQRLLFQLYHQYSDREAMNIADWVMENITGWKKIDRIIGNDIKLSVSSENLLDKYMSELNAFTPVQYVLNEAWFCGMKFFVNKNVLIPRPETEELVEWIISDNKSYKKGLSILDIGTGSGCIAVSLKKKLPDAVVYGCDIDESALEVARKNAQSNNTEIVFFKSDILHAEQWNALPEIDIIVSNPPYIPAKEKQEMNDNVVKHEPHQALFVSDNEPLVFYDVIGELAKQKLITPGTVYVETHENLAQETAALFTSKGFVSLVVKKDMQGKERMIKTNY